MVDFHAGDRRRDIRTREGLQYDLNAIIAPPSLLSRAQIAALTTIEREDYNRQRKLFMSAGFVINTPSLSRARATLRRLMAQNLGRNSGHSGLMISGDSNMGKTTISMQLMKYIFLSYKLKYPEFEAAGHVPVVYVEVPAGSTGKLLMISFATFFGLSVSRAETADSIRHRVVNALNTAGTQLVIVDELHNLSAANRGNGESVDILKALHNQVPATFVYCGLDLGNGALLAGSRGQQLSARFTRLDLKRFNRSDPDQVRDWNGVVAAFESTLPLAEHEPRSLLKLSSYLHDRTGGSIGSLGNLIFGAAAELIDDPDGRPEVITKAMLDDQILDMAAEHHYAHLPATNRKLPS